MTKRVTKKDGALKPKQICSLLHIGYDKLQQAIRGGLPVDDKGRVKLEEAREWLTQKEGAKLRGLDLLNAKKEAEISKLKAAEELQQIELAKARGELHVGKLCDESIAELSSMLVMELHALPPRIQSIYPESHTLENATAEIVNNLIQKIQNFARAHQRKT